MLYRRGMRGRLAALPLLILCLVGGCGESGESALRVQLETFSFDGALPDGLRLRRLDPSGSVGDSYALQPVPGGRLGEYEAPGAPEGPFEVVGPENWWMLQESTTPHALARGLQPPLVAMGRGRSLYLIAQSAEIRPSDVWGAVRLGPGGVQEPVPVTVEAGDRGYVVAVRFAPEAWRGTLRVVGRIASGPPPTPSPGADAPLAEPVQFEAAADGRPGVHRLRASATGPLHVVLVAASEGVPTEGLRVRASVLGLPIPSEFEAYAHGGLARFAGIPAVDRLLRLQVGDETGIHRLDPVVRRRQANVRLLVTGDLPLRRLRVLVASAGDVDLVLVRPQGAVAYGRVPFERLDAGVACDVPQGPLWIELRSGTRWASGRAEANDDVDLQFEAGDFREGVVVGGSVDGAPLDAVVRFFRAVGSGEQAVLGDGFEVRVEPGGIFEAHLPTGRYLVETATRAGVWQRPGALEAHSPGARLHLPLESP